jgi:hypothetical protein
MAYDAIVIGAGAAEEGLEYPDDGGHVDRRSA